MAVMEPGSLVMERKMLLGIKERADSRFAEIVRAGILAVAKGQIEAARSLGLPN